MEAIYLKIAGFTFRLIFYPTGNIFFKNKLLEWIKEHLSGFILTIKPDKNDFTIKMKEQNIFEIIRKIKGRQKHFLHFLQYSGKKEITSYYHVSISQFQYFFKNALLILLSRHNGFILHSSATNYHNSALLFVGNQRAGKSTAMSLLHPIFPSIGDDSVIIKKENKEYYMYQTPFIEKNYWVKKDANRYKINKVFFLKKSKKFKTRKIYNHEIVISLLLQQLIYIKSIEDKQIKHLLEFAIQFNKFYFLYFDKNRNKLTKLLENEK